MSSSPGTRACSYINKLARVFFAAIRSTCAEFVHLFENASKSSYMKWVNEQMTVFSDAFGRQVLQSSTTSFAACADCLQVAYAGCRSVRSPGCDTERGHRSLHPTPAILRTVERHMVSHSTAHPPPLPGLPHAHVEMP